MKENQNRANFGDNDKDELLKSPEFEWNKDLHADGKIGINGFDNKSDFVALPIVSFNKGESLKERNLYTDKNLTECELPELVVCYGENPIKDICVDDGVPSKENIVTDGENFENLVSEPEGKTQLDTYECATTREVGVESFTSEESKRVTDKEFHEGVIVSDSEANHSASDKIVDGLLNEKLVADDISLLGKSMELKSLKTLFDSRSSDGSDIEQTSYQIPQPKTTTESRAVDSPDDGSNKGNSDLSYNSRVERGTITFDFNSIKLESESINESLDNKDGTREQSVKLDGMPTHDSTKANNVTEENKVQHGQGESSFSMAGPVSGIISHSGSIPFSGSISIRSDSSTTSTRSFAFPVLPNEWNSSPVRMAKADRRRYRSNKGWRNLLFCCP